MQLLISLIFLLCRNQSVDWFLYDAWMVRNGLKQRNVRKALKYCNSVMSCWKDISLAHCRRSGRGNHAIQTNRHKIDGKYSLTDSCVFNLNTNSFKVNVFSIPPENIEKANSKMLVCKDIYSVKRLIKIHHYR